MSKKEGGGKEGTPQRLVCLLFRWWRFVRSHGSGEGAGLEERGWGGVGVGGIGLSTAAEEAFDGLFV